jgi:hypothetical protein
MFRIEQDPRYWWPVVIRRPHADKAGELIEHVFEAQFKWLEPGAFVAWANAASEKQLTDAQCMPEVFTAFRNVQRADGAPLDSTAENIELLLQDRQVAAAVAAAFIASRERAAEKN